jgi:1-acyl-sn-glycerol-3-phosphate acyltransferase
LLVSIFSWNGYRNSDQQLKKRETLKFLALIFNTLKFWILITLLSLILGVCAMLAPLTDPSGNRSHRISSLWARWLCKLNGIQVEITGLENILQDRAQIFVANHQSFFDIFALSGYLPVQIRWVAKASLFHIPFVGWSMKAAGYISVDRSNKKKAYQSFVATVEKVKQGYSVVIFPEGTRSEDGTIGSFKKGSHLLAVRAKAPMVPVTIIGTGNIIKKNSLVITPGPIRIVISPPVYTEASNTKDGENLLADIRKTICSTYAEKNRKGP